jgi:hypothetical protein
MKKWIVALCAVLASASLHAANDPQEEKQVLATLKLLSDATVKQDLATLRTLFHDDVTYGHSTGVVWKKAEVLEDTRSEKREAWDFKEPKVTIIGSTALVRAIMVSTRYPDNDKTKKLAVSTSNVLWVLVKGNAPQGWQFAARQNFRPPAGATR